jgi:hypothetical protein
MIHDNLLGHAWAPGAPPTAGAPRIQATQGRVHLDVTAASDRGRSSSSPPKNHRQGNPRKKNLSRRCPPASSMAIIGVEGTDND